MSKNNTGNLPPQNKYFCGRLLYLVVQNKPLKNLIEFIDGNLSWATLYNSAVHFKTQN